MTPRPTYQFESSSADEFLTKDLRNFEDCLESTHDIDHVYNLADDMGGIGYISEKLAQISRNNV